jgi:hypothetical protein
MSSKDSNRPAPCIHPGCDLQGALDGKHKSHYPMESNNYLSRCGYHNFCLKCNKISCWDDRLCRKCDSNK